MHTLRLEPATRTGEGVTEFLDYLVDDQSLFDWIRWSTGEPERWESLEERYVSPFSFQTPPKWRAAVRRMLIGRAPGDLEGGHVPLYVCPLCGDYGCGTVSVALHVEPDHVEWRELAAPSERAVLDSVPVFRFDRSAYVSALAAAAP